MFAVPANTVAQTAAADPARTHPVRIARQVAADRTRWRHLLRYDPDQRFAGLVESGADQEIWLLSWLPGQSTDLHDHGVSTGAFTVVTGRLTESVVRQGATAGVSESVHEVNAGVSRVFGPGYVHRVRNEGPDPAVSVHVYRSGGRRMRPYHLDPLAGPIPDA